MDARFSSSFFCAANDTKFEAIDHFTNMQCSALPTPKKAKIQTQIVLITLLSAALLLAGGCASGPAKRVGMLTRAVEALTAAVFISPGPGEKSWTA